MLYFNLWKFPFGSLFTIRNQTLLVKIPKISLFEQISYSKISLPFSAKIGKLSKAVRIFSYIFSFSMFNGYKTAS